VDGGDLARLGRPQPNVMKRCRRSATALVSRRLPLFTFALALSAGAAAAVPQSQSGVCGARAYGAKGDGRTLSTAAIQRAIDACASAGGGTVLLEVGTFISGTLVLKDNITLRIAPGATLLASPRISDFTPYPPEDVAMIAIDGSTQNKGNGPYHLIHSHGARNVAIDGGGTIRGNGPAYWDPDPERVFVSRRPRPSPLIEFVETEGIRIENITIRDAPGWTIHPLESSDIRISGITLMNDGRGPNTDGVNIDSSQDVLVTNSHIEAGDDCVVLKTTGRRGGRPVQPTERVVVSNILCSSDDQGLKIGTESLGDFRDILFTNSVIYHSPNLYRPPTAGISMSMVDGARFSNVIVSNIVIRDARTPIFLRLGNRGRGQTMPSPGTLDSVIFSNIVATGGTLASSITGLPSHPVRGVTLSDIDITMTGGGRSGEIEVPEAAGDYPHAPMFGTLPASGLYVRHVDGLTMRNVHLRTASPDERPALLLDDVADLELDNMSSRNSKIMRERKSR
jgi:polygalacturonase